jgi:hypothetical protein
VLLLLINRRQLLKEDRESTNHAQAQRQSKSFVFGPSCRGDFCF